jgi:hypothetical protein
VRAVASARLQRLQAQLARAVADLASQTQRKASEQNDDDTAHRTLLARDIDRALNRPAAPFAAMALPAIPPGAPIGEPALEFLRWLDPLCVWR